MKKILIHPNYKHEIAKEFRVSMQTVDMSLKYVFNSEVAKSIRKKAKEMLLKEANEIEVLSI